MSIVSTLTQATNLVLLISNTGADIRKFIVWQDDEEVLSGLQITRIAFEDKAKIFEHPIETGAVIADHQIYEPKSAVIQAYISNDDATTLEELENLYLSGTALKIRAGNKVVDSVVIAGKPNEIDSSTLDKTLYSITFKEVQEVTPAYTEYTATKVSTTKTVKSAGTSSRVNSGTKQAKQAKETSWLSSALKWGA